MAIALTETAADRRRIYRGFTRRNRLVGILRVLVPGVGLAVFVLLAGQVVIANLADSFSVGRITLQNDRMVVETPSYSGVAGDGSTYAVTALSAEAGLYAIDSVTLNGATLVINSVNGVETTAKAARAELRDGAQAVAVEDETVFSTSEGMTGSLIGMDLDLVREIVTASGAVRFDFADGERLEAADMHYDGATETWTFSAVTVTLPVTPRAKTP
jgi:lipopolysaccharide export system protein LptC